MPAPHRCERTFTISSGRLSQFAQLPVARRAHASSSTMITDIVLTPSEINMLHDGFARQEVCIAVYTRVFGGELPSEITWVLRTPPTAEVRAVVTAVEIEADRLRDARALERRQQREAADAEIAAAVPAMTANELLCTICDSGPGPSGVSALLAADEDDLEPSERKVVDAIDSRREALTSPDAGSLRVRVEVDENLVDAAGSTIGTGSRFPHGVVTGFVTGLGAKGRQLGVRVLLDDNTRVCVLPEKITSVDGKHVVWTR